ncbi:MAG: polymerase sigma factor, sigma-70 family, partial [Phycisphaerales bacterium]|nr:polymerase sigma factor, sigma-70 family [Phycisphaerales bacterium]
DRSAYVHALAAVAAMSVPALAPAATGGALLARVRRLLGVPDADAGRSGRWVAGALALSACIVLLALARVPLRAADPPQPEKKEQAAGLKQLTVKFVNDQTGEAMPDVSGSWWLDDRNGTDRKRYTSDSRGELLIPLEPGTRTVEFFYRKEKFVEGVLPLGGEFGAAPLTGTYTLRMKPGVTVGGVVHDETGAPVAGAHLQLSFDITAPDAPTRRGIAYGNAETGSDGRWTFDGAPSKPTRVEAYVKHPDFIMDSFSHSLAAGQFDPMFTKNLVVAIRRGVTVTGTVVDEQGHPIAKAEVTPKQFGLVCCTTTDAQGRFRLGGVEPGRRQLAAKADGYAPQLLDVVADKDTRPVEFRLAKGVVLRGRVVDDRGQPVPDVYVNVQKWRGSDALRTGIVPPTGADGRFVWNDAPADEVVLVAYHRGFGDPAPISAKAGGAEAVLILPRPKIVRGSVVDDATNKAVEKFAVHVDVSYVPVPHGITGSTMDRAGSNGKYEVTVTDDKSGSTYRIRVQADGYLPAESPALQQRDGQVEFNARLKRTGGMAGTVAGPDGKPAAGATVVLNERMAVQVEDGAFTEWSRTASPSATTDAAGHFVLPARTGSVKLHIIHESGWAAVARDAAAIGEKISLSPWCSVEGVCTAGGKPVAGRTITLRPEDRGRPGERDPFYYRQDFRYRATTDEAGRFTIRHVIDGDSVLSEEIAVQDGKTTSFDTSHSLRLALHAGEHRAGIQIGGTGRPVTARVAIPEDLKARGLVPTYGTLRLDPPRMPQPENWHTLTPQERFELRQLFERGAVYQDYAKRVQEIIAPITPEGALRAEDVPPGRYTLSVMALRTSPNDPTYLRPEASTECAIDVPEIPGGRSDQPLDLGVLDLQAVHYLQAGEPAPAFEATGFDHHPMKLADYRGKYVLLDFWATWCGPCIAEMKHLEEIHAKYGNDPRFVILGISVDDRAQEPAQFLGHRKLPWPQAFGGRTGTSSAWRAFGIGAIPSIWLIGPDGKILAKELEPEKIDETIKAALSRPQ